MSKRRRASSVASRGADGDESDSATELNTPAPAPSGRKKKRLDISELCQQLYDTIRSYKKEDGTLLCDAFIRAPKRRQEPQYYEVVSQPIDLLRVQQKLKTDSYEDVEELASDIELLVNNAKAFYKSDTAEHKDAKSLWTLFNQTRQALENGDEVRNVKQTRMASSSRKSAASVDLMDDVSETSTNNDDDNLFEELFTTVMAANVDGRPLHLAFQFLPSKRKYPEYYEVIENPVDLKTIAIKIQSGEYPTLNDLEKDLILMTRNACHFNEPGSIIYKDAKALKKIIQARKQELDLQGRGGAAKTSERIRRARGSRAGGAALSSAAVALLEPDNSTHLHSDDSGGEESDPDKPNQQNKAQYSLLALVKDYPGANNTPMSEPFWKLPSRRYYPDYYKEIKNPVSLNQIRNKIRRGEYGNLSEVAGDMNVMFENAKQYNVPSSTLYRDAVKLQKLMQQAVQEMLDIVQSSSSDDDESLSSVKTQVQVVRPRGRPRVNPLPAPPPAPGPATPSNVAPRTPLPLRKRLHLLQKHLLDFTCSDGRQPMLLFMEKPSKKLYPDYYNVIDKPIDMLAIEANIKNERYNSLEEMVADFKLMFSNCRQFNEEGSMIYEDANMLEKALNEKVKELTTSPTTETPRKVTPKPGKPKTKQLSPMEQKLRTLYDAIRDYRDAKNRQLALILMKLPNKFQYPDYYEVIKNPIDMERIAQKLKNGAYQTVNELASDFILMFDNACKYNEPDSQIYKDALVLQKICLQTKQMLREDDDTVPDVGSAVQELLLTLFTTVYNHQDEEGRCYSDSMAELPEHDETSNGEKVRAISLDLVKRRLDKGLYKRLDHFQEDMFAVWERARRLTRTDSQVFEDSLELQAHFIETRDQLCGHGSVLQSPALQFTKEMMMSAVELVKQCKLLQENAEEDSETRSSSDETMMPQGGAPLSQAKYNKGDFVYVQPKKGEKEPAIVQVDKLWTNTDDVPMIYANCYYRPHETFHVRTRRFLEQEVFKTDAHRSLPLDQVVGRCYVMNVKEYFKYKPSGFADKDVYVCESRYSTRTRSFKKIKVWEGASEDAALVARPVPLEPHRNLSVFRERLEKHKDELAELEVLENVQEKERPDVVMYNPLGSDDENTYYEQYNTVCSGVVKTGDYVYVVTDGGKQMIAQVDTIWETKDNKCYFRGPFLIFPAEVSSIITKPFFKQEVLLTTVHDSSPLVGIIGKCAVLHYDDYLKCRPTEIAESDVFVCESLYDESNRTARKLKSGLRRYEHSKEVTVDEVYYFSKPLGPPALATAQELECSGGLVLQQPPQQLVLNVGGKHTLLDASSIVVGDVDMKPQFTNLLNTTLGSQEVEMILESSLDESSLASPAAPPAAAPTGKKRKDPSKSKLVTGYILYSSEVRKAISANNPESTFGEISRIVGNEWRSLPAGTKQQWEERAAKCNEETAAKLADELNQLKLQQSGSNAEFLYNCGWDTCDYQFEDLADCVDHCIGEGGTTGHIHAYYGSRKSDTNNAEQFQCMWRGCARRRRGQPPFPNVTRLLRHVRDLHINKGNGKLIAVADKSRNYVPSSRKMKALGATAAAMGKALASFGGVLSPSSGGTGSQVSLSQLSPVGGARSTPSPHGTGGASDASQVTPAPPHARSGLDPLFVAVPPRAQRVQHSEAYIRYIEGLHSEQKYITPWEKTLAPAPVNPEPFQAGARLPTHWLADSALGTPAERTATGESARQEQAQKVVRALWALRDFMMRDALWVGKNL